MRIPVVDTRGTALMPCTPAKARHLFKSGERKPYGGTHSLGLKRGTLVKHARYGLCTVGGFHRKRQTISLHQYQSNKRLTQGAKVKDCHVLTWVAFRAFLVAYDQPESKGKGMPLHLPKKRTPSPPPVKTRGSPGPIR